MNILNVATKSKDFQKLEYIYIRYTKIFTLPKFSIGTIGPGNQILIKVLSIGARSPVLQFFLLQNTIT